MPCSHDKHRVIATCPACQKKVFLHHVLEARSQVEGGKPANPLFAVTMIHGLKPERHALTVKINFENIGHHTWLVHFLRS